LIAPGALMCLHGINCPEKCKHEPIRRILG